MQLVAYGAQDIYLTGNPQITFFKVVYRRHTNFSMESIQQTLNGTVANSGRSTCTISRNGDLVGRLYIQATNHTVCRVNGSAEAITSVELEIGGQRIDKHLGQWMEAWAELTENKTGRVTGTLFQRMSSMGEGVVNTAHSVAASASGTAASDPEFFQRNMDSEVVYVPLQFWFCRNPGLALPLIALQYHEVKVIFNWSANCITGAWADNSVKVFADYIYLDTDERRRFAQVSHEYLIEQVQHQSRTAGTSETLNFNHPVKELVVTGDWGTGAFALALDPTRTMTLKLNGHERFSPRKASYFARTQVWQHHSGEGGFVPHSILVYSFALKPEEHQPSGTCNFSRIDNAELVFSGNCGAGDTFAVNYNVLRIMSGMGGLAYSN
jgi:hypothetical protein